MDYGMFIVIVAWAAVRNYVLRNMLLQGRSRYHGLSNWLPEGMDFLFLDKTLDLFLNDFRRITLLFKALSVALLLNRVEPLHGKLFRLGIFLVLSLYILLHILCVKLNLLSHRLKFLGGGESHPS